MALRVYFSEPMLLFSCSCTTTKSMSTKIIEVKPFRGRWKELEATGVEPVFPSLDNYVAATAVGV